MRLAYKEYGKGEPVVLIHGFPFSNKMWTPQIEPIVANGFHLILPDLRGFGESKYFADMVSIENMAEDIAELLDFLNLEKVSIGGLSMGGYVALNLFRLFPNVFNKIILCDTTHSDDSEEKRNARFDLIENIENNSIKVIVEKVLPNLLSDHTKEYNKTLVSELEDEILKTNEQSTIAALRGMADRKDHTHILKKIKIPTLLMFGKEDQVTNVENARNMHNKIQNSKLEVIEKCGHLPNLEQPEKFNEILIDFLKTDKN